MEAASGPSKNIKRDKIKKRSQERDKHHMSWKTTPLVPDADAREVDTRPLVSANTRRYRLITRMEGSTRNYSIMYLYFCAPMTLCLTRVFKAIVQQNAKWSVFGTLWYRVMSFALKALSGLCNCMVLNSHNRCSLTDYCAFEGVTIVIMLSANASYKKHPKQKLEYD